jgi:hypothetical protein
MAVSILPWTDMLLQSIQLEYKQSPPKYHLEIPSEKEIHDIYSFATQQDEFDVLGLKNEMGQHIYSDKIKILKCTSEYGTIRLVQYKYTEFIPPWKLWWRIIRIFNVNADVLIFAHPKKRIAPPKGHDITQAHVNGGMTDRCNPKSIVIYRLEEVTRVLIHELFHASCSDPYTKDTPHIEADTEAWAEIILCAITAKGDAQVWAKYMKQQITWTLRQAATLRDTYSVQTPSHYAWRYIIGKIDVWKMLGLHIQTIPLPGQYIQTKSLRFTICEPENV